MQHTFVLSSIVDLKKIVFICMSIKNILITNHKGYQEKF